MALLLLLLATSPLVMGWSFTPLQPTVCQPLRLNYTGGTAPYEFRFILFNPASSTATAWTAANTSLLALTVDNPKYIDGSTTTMSVSEAWPFGPFSGGARMVVVGSDASGFATGGTTEVLTIGGSETDAGCAVPPTSNTTFQLSSFHDYPVNISACLLPTVDFEGGLEPSPVAADTIIPGGRSERTWEGTGTAGDSAYSHSITFGPPLNASMEVALVVGLANGSMPMAVSQLTTVLPSNYLCQASASGDGHSAAWVNITIGLVFVGLIIIGGVVYRLWRRKVKKRKQAAEEAFALAVIRGIQRGVGR